jgi:hypothetical protein
VELGAREDDDEAEGNCPLHCAADVEATWRVGGWAGTHPCDD